jgi:sugar lactone lactonase YvrE
MMMKMMRHGALALLAALLVSCGGIESPTRDSESNDAPGNPTLSLGNVGTATAGGNPVVLTAVHNGNGTVSWQLPAGSPGSLSAASGDSVNYLPPPIGTVASPTTVTVTANLGGTGASATITLNPTPAGVYLTSGTLNGFGNIDGTGSGARFFVWDYANLAVDSSGNAFVADALSTTVRKITPQGVVTTYAGRFGTTTSNDGPLASATFANPSAVALDRSDNLYVADSTQIRKITPVGTVTTLARAGNAEIQGLAVAADGSVYASSYNIVYRVTPEGSVTTVAGRGTGNFVDSPNGFGTLAGIALDASGNLIAADYGRNVIWQITPQGTVTTVAGRANTEGNTDGPGTSALFRFPAGVAINASGRIFVADASNRTIRLITRSGSGATVATYAGRNTTGRYQAGTAIDGSANVAEFAMPHGLAVNAAGELLVGDGSAIRKVGTNGAVSTVAGVLLNFNAADGASGNAAFDWSPYGGALWSNTGGTLYLAEGASNTIRKIAPDGTVTTVAGALYAAGSADGAAGAARFSNPRGIAGDASGNLYVSDNGNNTIRKIAADGTVSTLAGTAGASGTTDGTGSAARFTALDGIVLDAAGNLFVIDNQFGTEAVAIRKITPAGVVTTLTRVEADYAEALAIDASGNLYLAGYDQAVIYKIAPDGTQSVLAGSLGERGSADGTGTAARFNWIGGITTDPAGNLYAIDSENGTIRKITPAGVVTTVAGTLGKVGPTSTSAALPGLLPATWTIRYVGPNTLALLGDNGIFKVILP